MLQFNIEFLLLAEQMIQFDFVTRTNWVSEIVDLKLKIRLDFDLNVKIRFCFLRNIKIVALSIKLLI